MEQHRSQEKNERGVKAPTGDVQQQIPLCVLGIQILFNHGHLVAIQHPVKHYDIANVFAHFFAFMASYWQAGQSG
jgi:hypothetical protein